MTLTRYFRGLNPAARLATRDLFGRLHQELERDFERLFGAPVATTASRLFTNWAPAVDLHEDEQNLVVHVEVPGLKKQDFSISLHDGVLSVSGERKFDERREKSHGYRAERFEGRFSRSISLPKAVDADKVTATYEDGVLTITLPVAETARPRQITVKSN